MNISQLVSHQGERHLASLLREARLSAGLSLRELAARMGVSQVTVHEAEKGRDVRYSTLLRFWRVLPGLGPRALLFGEPGPGPFRPSDVWAYMAGLLGFVARELAVLVELGPDGRQRRRTELRGVLSTRGDLRDADRRTELMRVVWRGSAPIARRLEAEAADLQGRPRELIDGGLRHRFEFPPDLACEGMSYCCEELEARGGPRAPLPTDRLGPGIALVDVLVPVRRLSLRVEAVAGLGPLTAGRFLARRAHDEPAGRDEPELSTAVHGEELGVREAGGALTLEVEKPVPALSYGIAWRSAGEKRAREPDPDPGRPVSARPGRLPVKLRSVRRRMGLSQRQVGSVLGLSPRTVSGAEAGRDLRRSTLVAYVEAFAELRASDLFPFREGPELDRRSVGTFYRELFGMEAEEHETELELDPSGAFELLSRTRGLRRLRGSLQELRLQHFTGTMQGRSFPVHLDQVSVGGLARSDEVRTRVRRPGGGALAHELQLPPSAASEGVSCSRRLSGGGGWMMTAARAVAQTGESGPFEEAFRTNPMLPVRLFRATVRFPPETMPLVARLRCFPATSTPTKGLPDLLDRLHPEGVELRLDPRSSALRLCVEEPLPGLDYVLSWTLR